MNFLSETAIGILLPFLGTTIGAAAVFFIKGKANPHFHRAMLGFAAGVMTAASVWSLLLPSIEAAGSWIPAVTGFLAGTGSMMLLDALVPDFDLNTGKEPKLGENIMLFIAVTLHNIPEGMAVGVMYAGFLAGNSQITAASALALSLGIAIQNFPEGAIISMPLKAEGESKGKAFLGGVLSGVVEPVGAVLTLLAARLVIPALPYLLSFAAGAMLYVVVEELIPEMSQGRHSNIGTIFFAVGFSIMMTLDVALG